LTDLDDLGPVDLTDFDLEDFGVLDPFADFNWRRPFTNLDDFGVLLIFPALSDLSPDPPFPFPSPFGVLLSVDLDDFDTSAFEDLSFFAPFTPFAVFTALADLDPVGATP